jgi:hypothetical protein
MSDGADLARIEGQLVGAKTWMLVYEDADAEVKKVLRGGHQLDRPATLQLARRLFPEDKLEPAGEGSLGYTCPPDDEVHIGCFPGVSILAAAEFALEYPSALPEAFISAGGSGAIYLHAMHSVVDWFAFAKWVNGELYRSLSLYPEKGILEDIGPPLSFEHPFWLSKNPDIDDDENSFPFPNPLELGEAALKEVFGYQIEGVIDPALLDAHTVPLVIFKRTAGWRKAREEATRIALKRYAIPGAKMI